MTLSGTGEAETPAGGSVCMRLKSRINLLRAAVLMAMDWGISRGMLDRVKSDRVVDELMSVDEVVMRLKFAREEAM